MRRRRAEKRKVTPDVRFNNALLGQMIGMVISRGKKAVAERIVYGALEDIHKQTNEDPLKIFEAAVENIKPKLEVKSRRVGGATYQVPLEVSMDRQISLALHWLVLYSRTRKGLPMRRALSNEVLDAYKGQGGAVRKRDETHKMAQANRAFAHYRW